MENPLIESAIADVNAITKRDDVGGMTSAISDQPSTVSVESEADLIDAASQIAEEVLGNLRDIAAESLYYLRSDLATLSVGVYRCAAALERIAAAMERKP